MATAAASSASEPEVEPRAVPEAEGEEDDAKAARAERKVLPRAVAVDAAKATGPGWELQQEGVSDSDGDEEDAMASSAESSPGEDEWEYDEEEEKNQLEIERLEEQVGRRGRRAAGGSVPGVPGPGPPPWCSAASRPLRSPARPHPSRLPAFRALRGPCFLLMSSS